MEVKFNTGFSKLLQEVEKHLYYKKNFMIYDDYIDEKGKHAYRFFYSSEKDLLEFISFDIYVKKSNRESYGIISILTSNKYNMSNFYSIYGEVLYERTIVRSLDKTKISLVLNENGYKNMIKSLEYFENKLL